MVFFRPHLPKCQPVAYTTTMLQTIVTVWELTAPLKTNMKILNRWFPDQRGMIQNAHYDQQIRIPDVTVSITWAASNWCVLWNQRKIKTTTQSHILWRILLHVNVQLAISRDSKKDELVKMLVMDNSSVKKSSPMTRLHERFTQTIITFICFSIGTWWGGGLLHNGFGCFQKKQKFAWM